MFAGLYCTIVPFALWTDTETVTLKTPKHFDRNVPTAVL